MSALLLTLLLQSAEPFALPEGFRLERVLEQSHSFLALAFDAEERLLLATESAGLLRASDADGDGHYERLEPLVPSLERAQGLCVHPRSAALYAVGRVDGASGLWRFDYPAARDATCLVAFEDDDEHGAHAAVPGPDGDLWLSLGDQTRGTPAPSHELVRRELPPLVPAFDDPTGFGQGTRYPYGRVVSVDPSTGRWSEHSGGYRNAYDLAFTAQGEIVLVDSDMEWDMGLPWYRPTRLCLALPQADFGYRPGSRVERAAYADVAPVVMELGPGSPTGICVYEHSAFPERYRGAVLSADWARGVVDAFFLEADGAGYKGRREPLIEARGAFQVTDLEVAADGSLVLVTGGRASLGSVWRLRCEAAPPLAAAPTDALERALVEPRPYSAAARGRALDLQGAEALEGLRAALGDPVRTPEQRVRALNLLRYLGRAPELAPGSLAEAPLALRRCAAGWPLAHALLDPADSDPIVRRRRYETLGPQPWVDTHDGWLRHAARGAWAVGASEVPLTVGEGVGWGTHAVLREVDLALTELRRGPCTPQRVARLAAAFVGAEESTLRVELLHALIACARGGAEAQVLEPVIAELERRPWTGDADHDRAAAQLRARFGGARAVEPLLKRLEDPELAREERLDLAYVLRAAERGWTVERRARLFAFLDEAVHWRGGANHLRYMERLTHDLAERTSPGLALGLAAEGRLGPWSLAQLVAAQPARVTHRLLPAVRASYEAQPDDRGRRILLRALGTNGAEELAPWLRELMTREEALRTDVLIALAPVAGVEDTALLLEGLALGSSQLAETCARRLVHLASPPGAAEAAQFQRALMRAARISTPRVARQLVRVLERWWPQSEPIEGELDVQITGWQTRVDERFPPRPEASRSPLGAPARPRWDSEFVARFLAASAARAGSPAAGRAVYEATSCHTCHTMGPAIGPAMGDSEANLDALQQGAGWGPDLTTVARRLAPRDLLEAIWNPSLAVAERFRSTIVVTHDEEIVEGRVVHEDQAGVELVDLAGRRTFVASEEIATREVSALSPMPAGLLAERSLEEIKDLMAYLDVEGRIAAQDERRAAWRPLLEEPHAWTFDEHWTLEQGLLEGFAVGLSRNSYALFADEIANFELELDLRLHADPVANSGLQYRSFVDLERPDPVGYQADAGERVFGALYATDGRGELAAAEQSQLEGVRVDDWNHLYLCVEGDRHRIEWNGVLVVDVRDGRFQSGRVGLQLHERMAMAVRVANLRWRSLP